MTYVQARAELHRCTVRAVQPGLKRTKQLLEFLDHPQCAFPALQITGTNGKGSVAAFITSVLTAAGYQVGSFTSPHLLDERERISINGVMTSKKTFARATERLLPELIRLQQDGDPATSFEAWTVLAAEIFRQEKIDIAVVEVGMGGRLDATTAWDRMVLTLLTNVQLEHTAQLGNSKLAICREKLGIARKGVPMLSSETDIRLRHYMQEQSRKRQFPLLFAGEQKNDAVRIKAWQKTKKGWKVDFHSYFESCGQIFVPLPGKFQIYNAALALLALQQLSVMGFPISTSALKQGFRSVVWPGRMEQICQTPVVILDGAHNPAAAVAVTENWLSANRKINLVVGMMQDKDIVNMCRIFAVVADKIWTVTPPDSRAVPAAELAVQFQRIGKSAQIASSFRHALHLALQATDQQGTILVTGSLYNIEPARRALKSLGLYKAGSNKSV